MTEKASAIIRDICTSNVLENYKEVSDLNKDQLTHISKIEAFFHRIGRLIREGNQIIPEGEKWDREKLYRSYYTELFQAIDVGWGWITQDNSKAAIALREEMRIPEALESPKMLLKALVTKDAYAMALPALVGYYDFSPRKAYSGYIAKQKFFDNTYRDEIEKRGEKGLKKLLKNEKEFNQYVTKQKIELVLIKRTAINILEKYRKEEPTLAIHLNSLNQLEEQLEKRAKRKLKNGFGFVARNGKIKRKGKGGKLS